MDAEKPLAVVTHAASASPPPGRVIEDTLTAIGLAAPQFEHTATERESIGSRMARGDTVKAPCSACRSATAFSRVREADWR